MPSKRRPDPLAAAAYHEAGHAVMCAAVELAIDSISVLPDELFAGRISHRNPFRGAGPAALEGDAARLQVEKLVMVCLAGPVAERKYAPMRWRRRHGGTADAATAADLALRLFRSKTTAAAYLKFVEAWVRQKLDQPAHWRAVEQLAGALVRQARLSGAEAEAIIAAALRSR